MAKNTAPENDQAPQDPVDKHGPKYDQDVSISSWLRNGDATTKPSFDSTAARLSGGKHRDAP